MFKRQPSDTQLIFLTLALVLLLGVPTVQALTEPEEAVVSPVQRQPSSLPEVTAQERKSPSLSLFTKHDLNCKKRSAGEVEVKGDFIQLQGRTCFNSFQAAGVEIVNRSNGYTASVFDNGADKYQTDLIQLQKGINEISIRYRDSSGTAVEELLKVQSTRL